MATSVIAGATTSNITSAQKVIDMARINLSGHVKFSLIDLEAQRRVTGRKQDLSVHRERLSERTRKGCDSLSCNYNLMEKLQINTNWIKFIYWNQMRLNR